MILPRTVRYNHTLHGQLIEVVQPTRWQCLRQQPFSAIHARAHTKHTAPMSPPAPYTHTIKPDKQIETSEEMKRYKIERER